MRRQHEHEKKKGKQGYSFFMPCKWIAVTCRPLAGKKTSQSAVAAAAWALSMAASDDDGVDDDVKAAAAFVASGSILKIVWGNGPDMPCQGSRSCRRLDASEGIVSSDTPTCIRFSTP